MVKPPCLNVMVISAIFYEFYGSFVSGPIASASATRFSCRRVVMIGGLLASFSICFSGYANSLLFLYFIYGVIGGTIFIYIPAVT